MAIKLAPPALTKLALPVVVPPAVKAAASELLQLKVGVICVLEESRTVAVIVLLPLCSINEVWFVFSRVKAMDTTGQVMNCTVGLVTPETVVKIPVIPGVFAVTRAWVEVSPLAVVLAVATNVFIRLQLKGPTVEVMSIP